MPLEKDVRGGGTEKDGTKSADYCSKCYWDGRFIEPDMTVGQMQALVKDRMKAMHLPGFIANRWVKRIPELKRWKST
jgi:hypothetical protein